MAKKSKQAWEGGDVVAIPISDGTFVFAFIQGFYQRAMESFLCGITSIRSDKPCIKQDIRPEDFVAVRFVFTDLIDNGEWKIVASQPALDISGIFDIHPHIQRDFVGITVSDPGIIEDFLESYFALAPWDQYIDPHYFDQMLLDLSKKPVLLVYKSDVAN